MPTNQQPNLPSEEMETGAPAPEGDGSALAALAEGNEMTASEAAPFAGVEHDPGIEDAPDAETAEGGEGEAEAASEPIVYRELSESELQAAVEATFFMHHKPVSVSRLRELINPAIPEEEIRTAVSNLMAVYFDESRGIELCEVAGGYQFRTKPEHKDIMRRMYQIAPMKLTNAMLEVLAIAAYNQPITREVVDKIRGVDSSHLLRVLLDKKMLRIVGKSDDIGRPMIYGTTKEFLELFGLRDLSALPSLRELEDMLPKNEVGAEISEEEALAKDMEGIVDASKPLEFNDLELEEDLNETQKVEQAQQDVPALAHSDGRSSGDGSPEAGNQTDGDLDLPPEAIGRLPIGPEGNA